MIELTLEVFRLERPQQRDPARVDRIEKRKRDFDRRQLRIFEQGPSVLIVRLDGWDIFGQGQLTADVSVQVTVRHVVNYLPQGPAAFAVRRIQLLRSESARGLPHARGLCGDLANVAVPHFAGGGLGREETTDWGGRRTPKISQ